MLILLSLMSMAVARDCFKLFSVSKSMLLKENPLIETLSEIAELSFTEIEVKVESSLTTFCLSVS